MFFFYFPGIAYNVGSHKSQCCSVGEVTTRETLGKSLIVEECANRRNFRHCIQLVRALRDCVSQDGCGVM